MVLEIDIKEGLDENNENKMIVQKGGSTIARVIGVIAGVGIVTGLVYYKRTQMRIEEIKKEILKQVKEKMDGIRLEKRKAEHKAQRIDDNNYNLLNKMSNWKKNEVTTKTFALADTEDWDKTITVLAHDIIFLTVNDISLDFFYNKFKESMNENAEIEPEQLNNEIMEKINTDIPRRLHYQCQTNGKICNSGSIKGKNYVDIMRQEFNKFCDMEEAEGKKIQLNAIDPHKLAFFIDIKPGKKGFPTMWNDNGESNEGGCDFKKILQEKVDKIMCETAEQIREIDFDNIIIAKLSGNKNMTMDTFDKGDKTNVCKNILYLNPIHYGLNRSVSTLKKANMVLSSESLNTIKDETCSNLVKNLVKDIANNLKKQIEESLKKITGDKCDNIQKGGAVISKGSYGCIFKPAILCSSGKNSKSKKYISKLMLNEPFFNEREMRISELIKQIPNYSKRFSPILSLCDIEIKNIKDKDIKKCDDIVKHGKNYQPVIGKVRLVHGKDLHENYKTKPKKKFLQILLKSYPILLDSIKLLEDKYIVHHDIKSNNIIYDEKNNKPIIIDFGLSFSVEKIVELRKAFYVEWAPQWTLWPIEIHYLGFVISKKRNMYENELISFTKEYNNSHSVIKKFQHLIPESIKNIFYTETYNTLKRYNSKPLEQTVKFIINNYWKTWNNYSLSVTVLLLFLSVYKDAIEINDFNKKFIKMLLLNIHPNPKFRLSLKNTMETYKNMSLLLNQMDII